MKTKTEIKGLPRDERSGNALPNPWLIAMAVLLLWTLFGWVLPQAIYWKAAEQGSFGDMFGAVNALFSGLALAGVVYAILMQREELSLQREELAATREELRRSAEAQESSSKLLRQQLITDKEAKERDIIVTLSSNQPIFRIESKNLIFDEQNDLIEMQISIFNSGSPSYDLDLKIENIRPSSLHSSPRFIEVNDFPRNMNRGDKYDFTIQTSATNLQEIISSIEYRDIFGLNQRVAFGIVKNGRSINLGQEIRTKRFWISPQDASDILAS